MLGTALLVEVDVSHVTFHVGLVLPDVHHYFNEKQLASQYAHLARHRLLRLLHVIILSVH